jgi:hypothetical protein
VLDWKLLLRPFQGRVAIGIEARSMTIEVAGCNILHNRGHSMHFHTKHAVVFIKMNLDVPRNVMDALDHFLLLLNRKTSLAV